MENHIPNTSDLQKQLEIIFACAPGSHEIRIIGRIYLTSLDGQRLERFLVKDTGEAQAYAIGLARNAKEAIAFIGSHFSDYQAHNCYLAINRVSDYFKIKVRPYSIGDREYPIALSCTKAKDIQGICALIIDLDREVTLTNEKEMKLSASLDELKLLDQSRQEIEKELQEYGLKPNYQIMSGNGYQMAYFFPTQLEIEKTRKALQTILEGMREKYKAKASVDTAMSDPARVARLCGIWNRKPDRVEDKAQDRVYRLATLLSVQPQPNSYEDIEKLSNAMQAWQDKARERRKGDKRKEIPKATGEKAEDKQGEAESDGQNWIDERLRKVSLLQIMEKFHTIKVTGQTEGKTQLLCPYHDDHHPSAWISSNANGIEMLHCSSPNCPIHTNSKTAIHILMDNGFKFIQACLELFREVPPKYRKSCFKCRESIFLDGKARFNLDGTEHKCQRKSHQKQLEEITKEGGEKPVIQIIGGQLPQMVNQAEETIAKEKNLLYQRSGFVVRVLANTPPPKGVKRSQEALVIQGVEIPYLIELLTKKAMWVKYHKREDIWDPVDCPRIVAETYLARGTWKLQVLTGIIGAPTLRPDGSILEKPGYDEDTGLLFHPCRTLFQPIPQDPSKEDALNAIEMFRKLLQGFSFVEEMDFAVAMSAILTNLIRRSIRTAPLHGISAPKMGSGKSLLADVTAMISTGHPCAAMSQADSLDEEKKRLLAILMEGDPIVCIDNVERPLGSDALCSILTQEVWKERLLGQNKTINVLTSVTFLATGNNLAFQGDLSTRVLLCMLDPQCERPEERSFDVNLYKYIPEHRGELVKVALTILRAYHVAGRPKQNIPTYGRFEEWSDWIRSALIWLGLADPGESRRRIEDADPVRINIKALLANWHSCIKQPSSIKEVVQVAKLPSNEGLYDALVELAGDKAGNIDMKKFGYLLRSFQGRIENGLRLLQIGRSKYGYLWLVQSMNK